MFHVKEKQYKYLVYSNIPTKHCVLPVPSGVSSSVLPVSAEAAWWSARQRLLWLFMGRLYYDKFSLGIWFLKFAVNQKPGQVDTFPLNN